MILNVELQQCVIMDEEINVCITTLTLTGVKSTILPDIDHNPPLITKSTAQGDGMLFSASKIHLLFKWRHAQFLKIDYITHQRPPHDSDKNIITVLQQVLYEHVVFQTRQSGAKRKDWWSRLLVSSNHVRKQTLLLWVV